MPNMLNRLKWTWPLCQLNRAMAMVAIAATLSLPAYAQDETDWAQWRGPTRDGQMSANSPAWPGSFAGLKESWRVTLSPSYSGPVVSGDRVFTTETIDEQFEAVRAFDRRTGEELWSTKWEGAMTVPFFAKENGDWIRSTPAIDGDRLYVGGMRDVLVCLNAETGKTIWQLDFVEQFAAPLPSFGLVCSPLVDGDAVYVQAGASVFKLNKLTGEVIWRSLQDEGGMNGSAFSSPIIAEIGGQRQLVVQTRTTLAGLTLEEGEELWSQQITAFQGMNILTPTVFDGGVFTSAYGSKSEFYSLTKPEQGDWAVDLKWENKTQGYMSSPVVVGDHAYMHLRNERVTCINLTSGESTWTTQPFGKYWSMVAQGDRILALDASGELLLLQANPEEFTLLDRKQVSEESTWAHVAVSGKQIFVRSLTELIAFSWEDEE